MPTLITIEEPPDWEERHRLLFDRTEEFKRRLCKFLDLEFLISSDNDILIAMELLINKQKEMA